jgi:uncharacterized protein (DUF433 family)
VDSGETDAISDKLVYMQILNERITVNPDICNGKPTIRGKRITVQTILEFLGNGDSIDEILENYPTLEREDIYASLQFASSVVDNKYVIEPIAG